MWSINSCKEEIALSHGSKELFVQDFAYVFDQNWKHMEAGNETHCSWLYCIYCVGLLEAVSRGVLQKTCS